VNLFSVDEFVGCNVRDRSPIILSVLIISLFTILRRIEREWNIRIHCQC